jgi:hypothetical protein
MSRNPKQKRSTRVVVLLAAGLAAVAAAAAGAADGAPHIDAAVSCCSWSFLPAAAAGGAVLCVVALWQGRLLFVFRCCLCATTDALLHCCTRWRPVFISIAAWSRLVAPCSGCCAALPASRAKPCICCFAAATCRRSLWPHRCAAVAADGALCFYPTCCTVVCTVYLCPCSIMRGYLVSASIACDASFG